MIVSFPSLQAIRFCCLLSLAVIRYRGPTFMTLTILSKVFELILPRSIAPPSLCSSTVQFFWLLFGVQRAGCFGNGRVVHFVNLHLLSVCWLQLYGFSHYSICHTSVRELNAAAFSLRGGRVSRKERRVAAGVQVIIVIINGLIYFLVRGGPRRRHLGFRRRIPFCCERQ